VAKKSMGEKIADVVDAVIHPEAHEAAKQVGADESASMELQSVKHKPKTEGAFKGHPKFDKFN